MVFGLSSGWKYIKPAIAYHFGDHIMDSGRDPAPALSVVSVPPCSSLTPPCLSGRRTNRDGLLTFRMKPVKSVVLSRSDFPGVSGEIAEEKSLARRGKTNIVHAPPRLAE